MAPLHLPSPPSLPSLPSLLSSAFLQNLQNLPFGHKDPPVSHGMGPSLSPPVSRPGPRWGGSSRGIRRSPVPTPQPRSPQGWGSTLSAATRTVALRSPTLPVTRSPMLPSRQAPPSLLRTGAPSRPDGSLAPSAPSGAVRGLPAPAGIRVRTLRQVSLANRPAPPSPSPHCHLPPAQHPFGSPLPPPRLPKAS